MEGYIPNGHAPTVTPSQPQAPQESGTIPPWAK